MKFEISKSAFAAAVIPASRAVPNKTFLPILESLYLKTDGKTITIIGSDQEASIQTTCVADQDSKGKAGATCITSKILVELLSHLDNDEILTFETTSENNISCTWSNGKCNMPIFPDSDYPQVMRDTELPTSITINAKQLTNIIRATSFATMNNNETSPILAAVFFKTNPQDRTLTLVATDSLILALNPILAEENTDITAGEFCITKRCAEMIARFLPTDEDAKISVQAGDDTLRISTDNQIFECRTLKAKYVDYTRIIPANDDKTFRTDSESFLSALKIISTCSELSKPGVTLHFNPMGIISLTAEDTTRATKASQNITGTYEGSEFEITTLISNLIEAVSHIDAKEIIITMSEDRRPISIRPADYNGPGDPLTLLMPIRKANNVEPAKK